jgi:glutaminase
MSELNYTTLLEEIDSQIIPLLGVGDVASYIPELSQINKLQFGMSVCSNNGEEYIIGSAEKNFSIQSIAKVFSFALAYKAMGEELWKRIKREPSGSRFDSLVLLENEKGVPRNPFINAGALVIMDILMEVYEDPIKEILLFIQSISGNPNIAINEKVKNSEIQTGNRNYALAYYMKSYNNINSDVDDLISAYSSLCSIEMSCVDLARSFRLFSTNGLNPWTKERLLSLSQNKRINSILMTCGLYDAAGDFAYRVGIPAKSGVGGGIAGVIPNEMSIAVWSPALDFTGNSLVGIKALELFTTLTGRSIY